MDELIPYTGTTDKNGFPLNSRGEHFFLWDKEEGKYFIQFHDGTLVKFSPTDKTEVGKAADEISQRLADHVSQGLEDAMFLDFSEAGKKKLLERGYQPEKPAEIHGVSIYFDRLNNFLNYLGNAGGFLFKELVYLKFKNKINNHFSALKSGLYGEGIPKKRLDFVDTWINFTDGIMEQERRKFAGVAAEPRIKGSTKTGDSDSKPSHRIEAILHNYKVKARVEQPLTATEMRVISQRRYEAYLALYSPNSKTKKHKPETAEELQQALALLADYPKAQDEVRKALSKLAKDV